LNVRAGIYELDLRTREFRGGSIRVRLQDQPFTVLSLLLEQPGDVVTRDELRLRLWPEGTFVDFEHSLNAAIKRLRAALATMPPGRRSSRPCRGAAIDSSAR